MYMNDMIYIFFGAIWTFDSVKKKKSVQPEEYHKALTFFVIIFNEILKQCTRKK